MVNSAQEFVIFYAWQSDTPQTHSRYLIQEALTEACRLLNESGDIPYKVEVTSDTQGEPGLCDIPAAILAKIEKADAALLDLTFVAVTKTDNPNYCPNPNVLFELGYAANAIGFERLVCVMNEAHGSATETIFDVRHRRYPIRYSSPVAGKTREQAEAHLAASFYKRRLTRR